MSGLLLRNNAPGINIAYSDLIRNLLHSYFITDTQKQYFVYTRCWLVIEQCFPHPNQEQKLNAFFKSVLSDWGEKHPKQLRAYEVVFSVVEPTCLDNTE